uniref:Uncharacterized protein n=1 Tax=Molossus molossus TaxID=27622 RepID=A0A7J8I0Y0_MOLMO|nr:hypothetical protein HJG59_010815 [Molossus molossus]
MTKDTNLLGKFELTDIPPVPCGIPQIEVTFDIDADSILMFLLWEDIERMAQEAEKYKAEDEKELDKVSSKNALESYTFNMKATVEDEKLQGKISDEDKQKILDTCNEIINWFYKNQTAEKEECAMKLSTGFIRTRLQKRKNLNISRKNWKKVCNPIITKLYQRAGGMPGGMPGGFPGGGAPPSGGASSGPTIEEVN